MGGYNSGGHRWGRHRATVEACYRFDVKMLRNLLHAPPGATLAASFGWSEHGAQSARAHAIYKGGDSFFTLHFERIGEAETPAPQQIAVSFAPCAFGGRRAWFVCGLCQRRAFRLFLYPHFYMGEKRIDRFYCRVCLGLTYDQRRTKNLLYIGQARAIRVQKQLGDTARGWDTPPRKPKYMRWHTYNRLEAKHRAACELADAFFVQSAVRRFPELFAEFRRRRRRTPAGTRDA